MLAHGSHKPNLVRGAVEAAVDEMPDESWSKAEITGYLEFYDVEHTTSMTKAELLDLI